MKVGIISLGCSKNLVDSEMILGLFKDNKEISFVNRIEEADLLIINTCGFIESAKKESLDTIFEAVSKKKEGAKVVVVGCLVKRYQKELEKEIKEVDRFISISDYSKIGTIISELFNQELVLKESIQDEVKLNLTAPNFAYIKIAEGCKNSCSFCAIPLIRGTLVSKDKKTILNEVDIALNQGKEEIVLIAQDTTGYGYDRDDDYHLVDLLKDILKFNKLKYLKILYMYPGEVSDELIDLFSSDPRLIPYFDLPLQHINDKILTSMNRHSSSKEIKKLISKIRKRVKNSILRTTLIIGFPGETKRQFNQLVRFIKKYPFDNLGAFTYSQEENTRASLLTNQIDQQTKEERLKKIMMVQEKISFKLNKKRINKIYDVFVESYNPLDKLYKGRSSLSAPDNVDGYVYFTSKEKLINAQKVKVRITSYKVHDLIGVKI